MTDRGNGLRGAPVAKLSESGSVLGSIGLTRLRFGDVATLSERFGAEMEGGSERFEDVSVNLLSDLSEIFPRVVPALFAVLRPVDDDRLGLEVGDSIGISPMLSSDGVRVPFHARTGKDCPV